MSKKSLILSSSGLKNIVKNINNSENEFSFVFGEEKICMSKINADFISPLISSFHQSDPTAKTYKYPPHSSMTEIFTGEIISKLNNLCQGEMIEVGEEESKKFKVISVLLGNEELHAKLEELYPRNYKKNEFW